MIFANSSPRLSLRPLPGAGAGESLPQSMGGQDRDNSHVSKILPLTTLRTIDLGGKKISGCLFSRFCAEMSDFFQGNSAPEYVQSIETAKLTRRPDHSPARGYY